MEELIQQQLQKVSGGTKEAMDKIYTLRNTKTQDEVELQNTIKLVENLQQQVRFVEKCA